MLEKLTLETFSNLKVRTFSLKAEPEPLEIEMIEVSEAGQGVNRKSFSVLFRGPGETVLEQAIYSISNPETGDLDLFLVPVGPDKQGMLYEAVFT